jgi:hypothetical protein
MKYLAPQAKPFQTWPCEHEKTCACKTHLPAAFRYPPAAQAIQFSPFLQRMGGLASVFREDFGVGFLCLKNEKKLFFSGFTLEEDSET